MKFKEYVTYFEDAAKSNRVLRHKMSPDRITFRKMNIEEILTALKVDLVEISMVLENMEKRGRDMQSDNKRKLITGAFMIIKNVEKGNIEAELDAMDETEAVTEQLLAKMYNDVQKARHNKLYPYRLSGFDPNSIRIGSVHKLFGNWHGWRVEFNIEQGWANNLKLNEADWLHDTAFTI